jgi:4-diphosphocytidyl-2-C-methyl-D-erythritol kinase
VTNSRPPASDTLPSAVTVFAPAKVNLILRVLERRSDGFHNLWSLMQTIGLEDEVSIRPNHRHTDIHLQCDSQSLKADCTNLVYRAAMAVLEQSGRTTGLDIMLTKRIPMGAGLGGGSSDAAATILGLNRLLNLGWSQGEMAAVGEALGSDVPFFFFAPSAIVSGRGEHVHPLQLTGSRAILLVNPGFPIETKWAYQRLSASRSGVPALPESLAAVGKDGHLSWAQISTKSHNDFEAPVFAAYPVLQEIKRQLLKEGAEAALLSGSGATVFGVFSEERRAMQAAIHFEANPEFKVFVVPAQSHPLRFRA